MLNRRIWMLLSVLFYSQLVSQNVIAQKIKPGFSCDEQLNYSEMAICSNSYLSSLDKYLNILYGQYQELSFSPGTLKKEQLAWLRERNSCKTRECIAKSYDARIREIISGIKRIDSGFSALEPSLVAKRFKEKTYPSLSIDATIDRLVNEIPLPRALSRIISIEIHSFERLKRNAYRFQYSYKAAFPIRTITSSFIVDDSADMVSSGTSIRYIGRFVENGMRVDTSENLFATLDEMTIEPPLPVGLPPHPPVRLKITRPPGPITVNGGEAIDLRDQRGK